MFHKLIGKCLLGGEVINPASETIFNRKKTMHFICKLNPVSISIPVMHSGFSCKQEKPRGQHDAEGNTTALWNKNEVSFYCTIHHFCVCKYVFFPVFVGTTEVTCFMGPSRFMGTEVSWCIFFISSLFKCH